MIRILAALVQAIGPWLITEVLSRLQKKSPKTLSETDLDQILVELKAAKLAAQDGEEITPEQKEKLREAFRKVSNY